MHRSAGLNGQAPVKPAYTVHWPEHSKSSKEWLSEQPLEELKVHFEKHGYLVVKDVVNEEELQIYRDLYDKILKGEIDASLHRQDLGSHEKRPEGVKENIVQIMWPSLYIEGLKEGPIHQRLGEIGKFLFGDDLIVDFDFMMTKSPKTESKTLWHSDEAFWLDMPDKRAISFWTAMDETFVENGCLWFVPGSHLQPLRPHEVIPDCIFTKCEGSEDQGKPAPLMPGWCTGHAGRTIHYSRGNSTDHPRRGFVFNMRPAEMVKYERDQGCDHAFKGLPGKAHEEKNKEE